MLAESQFNEDQKQLYETMSNLSELFYCAGWQLGNEAFLWDVMRNEQLLDKDRHAEALPLLDRLRELSERTQGWIIWWDDSDDPTLPADQWGPRFLNLNHWKRLYASQWGGEKG